ncbi:MAG: hypothetical protein Q7Q73_14630 [Verrucomicrobiota bacterium JB024]|nr:hypothetical protein [Verrucomicrobiota bacterium JB024]
MTARLTPFLYLSLLVSVTTPVWGQTASSPNEGAKIGYDITAGTHSFRWWARDDYYYYIQERNDLMSGSWAFFPYAVKGEDGIEGIDFSSTANMLFFRLAYTNDRSSPLVLADRDGDGFSDLSELDMGTNPFDDTDVDINGVPDDIDALWTSVPNVWKQAIVNSDNANIYDPEGHIQTEEDIHSQDDYDGDGVTNIEEWFYGTDPDDFYNGQVPQLFKISGDYQKVTTSGTATEPYTVLVLKADGTPWANAPVVFSIATGDGSLRYLGRTATSLTIRTFPDGRTGNLAFTQYTEVGQSSSISCLAGSSSVTFDIGILATASAGSPARATNVTSGENQDGSITLTWTDASDNEHYFKIFLKDGIGRNRQVGVAPANSESYTVPAAVVQSL